MHLSPQLAVVLTLGALALLFVREVRGQRQVSGAVWIPVMWLTITGSRFVSQWLNIFGLHLGAVDVEDGSPIDAVFFGLLILSGVYILYQRRVRLSEFVRNNRWVTLFLAYCFISILWSDFPFVAFKRWLKVLGHPVMALLILTEADPEEAIIQVMKRSAYVWILVSVLFIKYFPELGRGFDPWNGSATNGGITTNKNLLGLILFISGAFFFWYFLRVKELEKSKQRRNELILIVAFGFMTLWLLHASHSTTSLVSLVIASFLMLFAGLRWVNPRLIGIYLLSAAVIGIVAQEGFDVYAATLHLLGKSPTLTDRTLVWHDLLKVQINPIVGTGFESFWLGDRLKPLWAKWWWHPNEAHNAYLETYLNLGLAGLFLLLGWFVATYRKASQSLVDGSDWGRFRLGFLVASIFYGWTEAAFKSLDPVFFMFFLISIDYPRAELAVGVEPVETAPNMELVSATAQNMANNEHPVTM